MDKTNAKQLQTLTSISAETVSSTNPTLQGGKQLMRVKIKTEEQNAALLMSVTNDIETIHRQAQMLFKTKDAK